jgi:hypothetical protein
MSEGRTPRAYISDVPAVKGGDAGPMVYVEDFAKLGIGARSSGLPKTASSGPKGLDHVGGSAGGKR